MSLRWTCQPKNVGAQPCPAGLKSSPPRFPLPKSSPHGGHRPAHPLAERPKSMPQPVRSRVLASGPSFSALLLERVGQNANEHRPWKLTAEVQSARLKVNGKEKF
uniref:HDC00470 n=1 Tax=Drosophila melanogaster TaxID=7227 RepID=Q6IHX1_DROME|nr:TPA_inf: HDC00470 [Drosophila melanogaster]